MLLAAESETNPSDRLRREVVQTDEETGEEFTVRLPPVYIVATQPRRIAAHALMERFFQYGAWMPSPSGNMDSHSFPFAA